MCTNLRNSGQILQGKQEQLESGRGVPLGYILVSVVLNTPPRLHLANIFLCEATLLKIQTHSSYRKVYLEFPFPFNSLILSMFNLKSVKNTCTTFLIFNISFNFSTLFGIGYTVVITILLSVNYIMNARFLLLILN